jgi:hypothetical protein
MLNLFSFNRTTAREQWDKDRTGRLAVGNHLPPIGWLRLPDDSPPFKNGMPDPTGGPNSPHIEIFFFFIIAQDGTETRLDGLDTPNNALSVDLVNLNPASRKVV